MLKDKTLYLRLDEAADELQVSRRTLEKLLTDEAQRKRLGAEKIGGQWRFSRYVLENMHKNTR